MRAKVIGWRRLSILIEFLGEKTAYLYVWLGFALYLGFSMIEGVNALTPTSSILQLFGGLNHIRIIPLWVLCGFLSGGAFLVARRLYRSACPPQLIGGHSLSQIEEKIRQDVGCIRSSAEEKISAISKLRRHGFEEKKQIFASLVQATYGGENAESFFAAMMPYFETSEEIDVIKRKAEEAISVLTVDELDTQDPPFRTVLFGLLVFSCLAWIIHIVEVVNNISKHIQI